MACTLAPFKKNRFEPSFALGLALKPDQVKKSVSLSDPDFSKYVAGETFSWSKITQMDGIRSWLEAMVWALPK